VALTIPLQVSSIHFLRPTFHHFLTSKPGPTSTEPPFDRHDWIVHRPETGEDVRYIIDYYSAPPLPDGSPVFSLDVRPALDSVAGIQSRVNGWKEIWSNAATRENKA
jgi:cytochrome c heme-lyase